MRKHHCLGLVISLCAASASAEAAEQGFYLGIEAGRSRSDVGMGDALVVQRGTLTGTSRDEKDSAYGAYFGYTVTKHFGIELSYSDIGETRYMEERDVSPRLPIPAPPFGGGAVGGVVVVPERQETTIDSESFSLALIGRYPITETVAFTGRAGLAVHVLKGDLRFWFDEDEIVVIGGAFEQSSGAALFGAGIEWDFHPNWHARLQVQQHFMLEDEEFTSNVARGDVTLFTGGIAYRF